MTLLDETLAEANRTLDELVQLSPKEENENEALLAELLKKDEIIAEVTSERDSFRDRLFAYETEAQKAKDKEALSIRDAYFSLDLESLSPSIREEIASSFLREAIPHFRAMTLDQILQAIKD